MQESRTGRVVSRMPSEAQREICEKFGAPYLACEADLKIGISRNFHRDQFPINGLRHSPQGDTTGWYIWSGEEFSTDTNFFVPLHSHHVQARCPEIVKYLGLGSGWRFLFAPDHEDAWFDAALLNS